MKKNKITSEQAFENYYSSLYGERWSQLRESFLLENDYFEFSMENCRSYFLDCASVLAASCLPVENAENILDLCAAPGGKTLVLAARMKENAMLVSNERSAERRNRLISVINESLSENVRERITVTGFDGSLVCKKYAQESFDSILLDAPCSSERHVFTSTNSKYLNQWSAARIKNLSFQQWSLLSSCYRVLKTKGHLLYSTCAISLEENDGVMQKLLKKFESADVKKINFNQQFAYLPPFLKVHDLNVEETEYGYQILPDRNNGAGPIYFSLVQKRIH